LLPLRGAFKVILMDQIQRNVKGPSSILSALAGVIGAITLPLLAPDAVASQPWRYVLPPPGDPFEHPPMRALALSRDPPDNIKELVRYRGARQRYAQIRFGSPGSVRVTVVLDEVAPDELDVYVDADRNRRIEARDKVPGQDRVWRLPLNVAVIEGESIRLTPRAAIFKLGATGLTFSFSAAGYLEGNVNICGREHAARRSDGNGNGFLTDSDDRLWIDLDDDGRWDPTREQFLYATILTLGADRYAARSDELGTRLAVEALEGAGAVELALQPAARASRVAEIHATLIGRDGSAVGLDGLGQAITVPSGEYRVGTLALAFEDPGNGPKWSFIFSDNGGKPEHRWHKLEKGAAVVLDPVGTLELETGVENPAASIRAGDDIALQPRLYTGQGLLINACFRGTPSASTGHDGAGAEITLRGAGPAFLAVARSGFA
jgi:hypothetical protein